MQAFMAATKNANNSRHIVFGLSAQSRKQLLLKLCCNPSTSQAPKGSHSRKPEQVRMVIRTAARDCVFDALVLCWAGLRPIISLARLHVAARLPGSMIGNFVKLGPFQFCNGFRKAVAPMPRERFFLPTLCFPQITMRRLTDAPR